MDNNELPRGRTSSLFLFALLTFGTAVLLMVPFLSERSKYHISFIVVCVWEEIFYVLALFAMTVIFVLRKNRRHLTLDQQVNNRKQSFIQYLAFIAFGISASILPFYECKQVSTCFRVNDSPLSTLHSSQFTSYLFLGIYNVSHSIFALACHRYRCKSFFTRLLVAVILSANLLVLENSIMNTIRATNAFDPKKLPGNHSTNYYFEHKLVFSFCGENGTEVIDRSNTTFYLYKYTYSLLGQFVYFSLVFLLPLWNIFSNQADENRAQSSESIQREDVISQEAPDSPLLLRSPGILITSLKNAARFISQHSIVFSLVFVLALLITNMVIQITYDYDNPYNNRKNIFEKNLTQQYIGYYYVHTFYTYVISIVPFIGYFIARQKQNHSMLRFNSDGVILILSACGHLFFIVFETVDSISVLSRHPKKHLAEDVVYFIKVVFNYVAIYFQTKILLKASSLRLGQIGFRDQMLHVKGIIIFIGLCNAERWLSDMFFPPTVLRYANDIQGDDTFGHKNWWFIVQIIYPIFIFYRFWSALLCFKINNKLKR